MFDPFERVVFGDAMLAGFVRDQRSISCLAAAVSGSDDDRLRIDQSDSVGGDGVEAKAATRAAPARSKERGRADRNRSVTDNRPSVRTQIGVGQASLEWERESGGDRRIRKVK
jgi:hypothetical protein